jgi:signal peptidase I
MNQAMAARSLLLTATVLFLACLGGEGVDAAGVETPPRSGAEVAAVFARIGFQPIQGDKAFRIPSSGMEPTLRCATPAPGCSAKTSDRIAVRPYRSAAPARGDIVAFETPPAALAKCGVEGIFVQRLIGLPGDRIEVKSILGNGWVFSNGKKLKEPCIQMSSRPTIHRHGPLTLGADQFFVMGDNRLQACDSRVWGTIPRSNLIGKTIAIYWPPARARRV